MTRKLSPEVLDGIPGEYLAGASIIELARRHGCTPSNIAYFLKRRGVKARPMSEAKRRLPLNQAAFDPPLSDEARYWAGFLMADGCAGYMPSQNRYYLSLSLALEDVDHVYRFRSFLGSGHAVYKTTPSRPTRQPMFGIGVASERLVKSLWALGVVPRKSKGAVAIGLEACPHFWRGCVDGDGFVTLRRTTVVDRPYPIIGLTGSRPLLEQFSHFMAGELPGCKGALHLTATGTIYSVSVGGKHAVALSRILYPDSVMALPRKAETAHKMRTWESRKTVFGQRG